MRPSFRPRMKSKLDYSIAIYSSNAKILLEEEEPPKKP